MVDAASDRVPNGLDDRERRGLDRPKDLPRVARQWRGPVGVCSLIQHLSRLSEEASACWRLPVSSNRPNRPVPIGEWTKAPLAMRAARDLCSTVMRAAVALLHDAVRKALASLAAHGDSLFRKGEGSYARVLEFGRSALSGLSDDLSDQADELRHVRHEPPTTVLAAVSEALRRRPAPATRRGMRA